MADDDNEKQVSDDAGGENVTEFPAVSGVIFDERTGTVTLQLTKKREQ